MAKIIEADPNLFRIATFLEPFNLQFSRFLVPDAEPLLFHTGTRALFPAVKKAVASFIDVRTLRYVLLSVAVSVAFAGCGATRLVLRGGNAVVVALRSDHLVFSGVPAW